LQHCALRYTYLHPYLREAPQLRALDSPGPETILSAGNLPSRTYCAPSSRSDSRNRERTLASICAPAGSKLYRSSKVGLMMEYKPFRLPDLSHVSIIRWSTSCWERFTIFIGSCSSSDSPSLVGPVSFCSTNSSRLQMDEEERGPLLSESRFLKGGVHPGRRP
jgi:hypothetical protein